MNRFDDVIAAIATPPGTGGVAIIRVSGNGAAEMLSRVFSARGPFEHGRMVYGNVMSSDRVIDSGYAVVFYAPHSYTGQDTVELQVHGGAVSSAMVLKAVTKAGARIAEPGEFTKRAFLNGRMDLAQAQAVGDLIGALSEAGAQLALRQSGSGLHSELESARSEMLDIAARIEAILEYPEEDIEEADALDDAQRLRKMASMMRRLAETAEVGRTIRDGLRVTLAGAPNAGKSSIFNALCDDDVAIVTATPGTTRDCLNEMVHIGGAAIRISDTAGLRETPDAIESEGVARTVNAASQSGLVLFVVDGSSGVDAAVREAWECVRDLGIPVVGIVSKNDLSACMGPQELMDELGISESLSVSARSGEGMQALRDLLYERSCADALREETILLSDMRQVDHMLRSADAAERAADLLAAGGDADCAAMDLRDACRELGMITGETADEEVIDRIFSKFCLGK